MQIISLRENLSLFLFLLHTYNIRKLIWTKFLRNVWHIASNIIFILVFAVCSNTIIFRKVRIKNRHSKKVILSRTLALDARFLMKNGIVIYWPNLICAGCWLNLNSCPTPTYFLWFLGWSCWNGNLAPFWAKKFRITSLQLHPVHKTVKFCVGCAK